MDVDSCTKSLEEEALVKVKAFSVGEKILKRSIDLVGGLVGVVLFLIASLLLFLPYRLSSKKDQGPMFFKQERYGLNGQIFYIYKFRTMIVDAEHYLETHPEVKAAYHENGNKLEADPRVTKIGSFIRQHSIDELPQFLNVLKGEMSLVGPRPIQAFEVKEFGDRSSYLFMCKPGITGYWTTHGRSNVKFPRRADLELYYLQRHSTVYDLKLLFMTVAQTFNRSDAF